MACAGKSIFKPVFRSLSRDQSYKLPYLFRPKLVFMLQSADHFFMNLNYEKRSCRGLIHERSISFGFLGIILRVLSLSIQTTFTLYVQELGFWISVVVDMYECAPYGVRSPKFIWAPCAQLYPFMAETPPRVWALLVSDDRRHLLVTPCSCRYL
jgi:hypothetical protein